MESTRFDNANFMETVSVFMVSTFKLALKSVAVMIAASFIHLAINVPLFGGYVEDFLDGFAGEYSETAVAGSAPERKFPERTLAEWRDHSREVDYKTLFRNAEEYTGKPVYFRGKVVQVLEGEVAGSFQLRVNVTPPPGDNLRWWTDTVYLFYYDAPVRPLEDDIISFVGWGDGVITYTSTTDMEITIPSLLVEVLEIEEENLP